MLLSKLLQLTRTSINRNLFTWFNDDFDNECVGCPRGHLLGGHCLIFHTHGRQKCKCVWESSGEVFFRRGTNHRCVWGRILPSQEGRGRYLCGVRFHHRSLSQVSYNIILRIRPHLEFCIGLTWDYKIDPSLIVVVILDKWVTISILPH